jgi:hypothetical protein
VLFKLLGAPLSLPVAGVKFVFQQLADLADQARVVVASIDTCLRYAEAMGIERPQPAGS